MQALAGFHFALAVSGAPAPLDPAGALSLARADGDFTAPDKAQAAVLVRLSGFVTRVEVISIAGQQWQTNPLTGQWEELPPDWGFNPAVLFDAEIGLQAILADDLDDLALTGRETLADGPEAELYALTGVVVGERLRRMSGGLIESAPVAAQLWVAPETFELARVILTETAVGEEEARVWQVDFTNYDRAATIEPPA